MVTDPISDFLTRLRNASRVQKKEMAVPASKIIKAIAKILMEKYFIENFTEYPAVRGKYAYLTIALRTDQPPLQLKQISKPGQRLYIGYKDIKRIRSGLGIALISTSRGVLTGEESRKQKIGGEYLCEIY